MNKEELEVDEAFRVAHKRLEQARKREEVFDRVIHDDSLEVDEFTLQELERAKAKAIEEEELMRRTLKNLSPNVGVIL